MKADYQADRFSFSVDEEAIARAERFDGKLVLVTNVADLSASEIVTRYKNPADIERASECSRATSRSHPYSTACPIAIRAHALICFLALVLYRVMRMRLKASGSSASPKTALEMLRRIQKHRATIGERTYTGISKTTPEQLDLFAVMSLPKP